MCSFKSIYFVIFILNLYKSNAQISDKRLCGDPDCKEPVSLAKTLIRYSSPDARILSFAPNTDIKIYSKEAGSETNLWGAEIRGKRGYVPKHLVREYKVLKVPKLLVDTEPKQQPQVPKDVIKENVKPNKVQESFEVVDGTTIYVNPQDVINPSSTESSILSTAAPDVSKEERGNIIVEDSKEKDAVEEDGKEESVVENVISTFSNWMTDDSNSEELEDMEDDDEEEEDEEEDEDDESVDSLERSQNQANETGSESSVDMNSLHNLPPGVTVSTYNLNLNEPPKENVETKNVVPAENVGSQEKANLVVTPSISPLPGNNQQIKENKEMKPTSEEKKDVVQETTSNTLDSNKTEKKEEIKREADDKVQMETTTEAIFADEEPLPILADVTPNPLNVETEEKASIDEASVEPKTGTLQNKLTKDENLSQSKTDPTNTNTVEEKLDQNPQPPLKIVQEVPTNTVEEKIDQNPQPPLKIVQEVPANTVEDKHSQSDHDHSPVHKEEEKLPIKHPPPPPLGGLFNKAPNLVPIENAKKEEALVAQSVNMEVPKQEETASIEVFKENVANEEKTVGDVPKEESTNKENDAPKQEATSEENITNDVSNEDSANKGNVLDDIPKMEIVSEAEASVGDVLEQDVINKVSTEEENILKEDNIDIDSTSKEETSNDDVAIDDKGALNEDISEEILNDGDNSEAPVDESIIVEDGGGILSNILSFFGGYTTEDSVPKPDSPFSAGEEFLSQETEDILNDNVWSSQNNQENVYSDPSYSHIDNEDSKTSQPESSEERGLFENLELNFNTDIFLYLITTAISVILFLFGYMALDKNKREAPLVAKINKLEKQLLITLKENELLQENGSSAFVQEVEEGASNQVVELTQTVEELNSVRQQLESKITELERELLEKEALEEQIENLEKELETSTEVGMELNRIISEMLDPTNGSDRLKENVEQLQRQLLEQKDTINTINESLRDKEAENKMLREDLEWRNTKEVELQAKLDEMVERIMKIEKERDEQQNTLQTEIALYRQKYSEAAGRADGLSNDMQVLRVQLLEAQRQAEIKTKEYQTLKESLDKIKSMRNDSNALKSLLDATSTKAELQQLKGENEKYIQQLQQEQSLKVAYEKKYEAIVEEIEVLKQKYEQADKEKMEANSKLAVLNNYFKKRETELQEEVVKYKSIWDAKEGEATSTTERIKYMQEEIENYKAQNETLKQEIISQEIELKSQISMLEKKVHENWVAARQADRKLEDARQEAAQLRNRLTLRERAFHDERSHNRLQSPIEQNGELPLSPHPIDSPASPPLLYGRDHITKSPPLPGLPPFLPPPPGAPFMPPPIHGMPPFMPPPPSMYPGDHRPPPLGRMSSPPLNSRYSPDSSAFSPYDRHSPSPPYDSEYGASPPPIRGYSPYNSRDDRRDYKRPPHARTNGRNTKGSRISSGSEHSNDSLDKINRKQSKMV